MARIFRNNKTKGLYKTIGHPVINTTNELDGQVMVLYTDVKNNRFVREWEEFHDKFTLTTFDKL